MLSALSHYQEEESTEEWTTDCSSQRAPPRTVFGNSVKANSFLQLHTRSSQTLSTRHGEADVWLKIDPTTATRHSRSLYFMMPRFLTGRWGVGGKVQTVRHFQNQKFDSRVTEHWSWGLFSEGSDDSWMTRLYRKNTDIVFKKGIINQSEDCQISREGCGKKNDWASLRTGNTTRLMACYHSWFKDSSSKNSIDNIGWNMFRSKPARKTSLQCLFAQDKKKKIWSIGALEQHFLSVWRR